MKSISSQIDGFSLAAEVRMERQKHKGAFLLVEGGGDIKRFSGCVDEQACSFVNCFGKSNVIDAIERLYDEGFQGALGLIDADFERITGSTKVHEGIVVSDSHDFDMDAVAAKAVERYLGETAELAKLQGIGGARAAVDQLLIALKPLSCLRLVNEKYAMSYRLTGLDHPHFFDGTAIDKTALVDHVSLAKMKSPEAKTRLSQLIAKYEAQSFDLYQLTCGHDFCAALGIALRGKLGKRLPPQTWRSEVELHLRLAYSIVDLMLTKSFQAIRKWEDDHEGKYRILVPVS